MRMIKIAEKPCAAAIVAALVVAIAIAMAVVPAGAKSKDKDKDDYKKHPGYVDFEAMGVFGDLESAVEVLLKGPMLDIAKNAVEEDDPELAGVLGGLKLVRVQVFNLDRSSTKEVRERTKAAAAELEKRGWEIMVRVREDDENVYVYTLPSKKGDMIDGMVVMVVDDGDEAVFVNIAGTIDPAQMGKLGESFHLNELGDINIDFN